MIINKQKFTIFFININHSSLPFKIIIKKPKSEIFFIQKSIELKQKNLFSINSVPLPPSHLSSLYSLFLYSFFLCSLSFSSLFVLFFQSFTKKKTSHRKHKLIINIGPSKFQSKIIFGSKHIINPLHKLIFRSNLNLLHHHRSLTKIYFQIEICHHQSFTKSHFCI